MPRPPLLPPPLAAPQLRRMAPLPPSLVPAQACPAQDQITPGPPPRLQCLQHSAKPRPRQRRAASMAALSRCRQLPVRTSSTRPRWAEPAPILQPRIRMKGLVHPSRSAVTTRRFLRPGRTMLPGSSRPPLQVRAVSGATAPMVQAQARAGPLSCIWVVSRT